MKLHKKVALLSVGLMAAIVGLGGCKSNAKMPINFVAVTSSDYDATVQFGDYDYKFQGRIKDGSKDFTLVAKAVSRHATSSSGGGMGGFPGGGFPGGGFPGGGNSSGPAFEGFGAEEAQQPGGEEPGGFPGMGGDQGQGGDQQQGGFPGMGGDQGQGGDQQQGGDQGQAGFPGMGEDQGQQGGDQTQQGGDQQQGGFPGMGGDQGQGGFPGMGGDQGQGGDQSGQQESAAIESITLSLNMAEAFINQTVTATATILPEAAKNQQVVWTSSDEKVATVNNGSISPLAAGTTTITVASAADPTIKASADLLVKVEELAQYNVEFKATCTAEKGYGYKLVFDDEGKTEVHTDFDKTEGRHEFYYRVTIGEKSEVLKFQAKDPTFKDSLAKDYQKWDIRDAKYIFYAKATGNNNSVATAYMYLHKTNNEVTVNTPSGANRSLEFGLKWEEKDGVLTVRDSEAEYVADNSRSTEHPGFRLVYNGNTYYCSLNPEFKWKKFTTEDFEGANTHAFKGSYTTTGPDGGTKDVNFNLVEDGTAKLYLGSETPSFIGSWVKDAAGKLTITIEDKVGEFVPGPDGKYSITLRVSISSFFGSSTVTINLEQTK